jgi:hypothetical protein
MASAPRRLVAQSIRPSQRAQIATLLSLNTSFQPYKIVADQPARDGLWIKGRRLLIKRR